MSCLVQTKPRIELHYYMGFTSGNKFYGVCMYFKPNNIVFTKILDCFSFRVYFILHYNISYRLKYIYNSE